MIPSCLQEDELAALATKARKPKSHVNMQALQDTYMSLASQGFSDPSGICETRARGFDKQSFLVTRSRQKNNIQLAKKQQGDPDGDDADGVGAGHVGPADDVPQSA